MTTPKPRAWRVWIPAVAMMLVSLISYIDRNTLAILAPTILAENHLSAQQYGWIISAFSIAYMIGNPLWGRALDRFGVRWGMLAAVAFWTAASASHALVSGFLGFALARAALGFGEGATFPGGLRTALTTLPEKWRARGVALAYSGGSLGAVVAPLIVQPVADAHTWRGAFLFTGLIGALWLLLWLVVGRTVPQARAQSAPALAIRWRDRRVWSFIASYALGCLPLGFVIYGAPIFLSRAWHKPQADVSSVLWIPPLGWEIGYFAGGYVLDRFHHPHRRMTWFWLLAILPLAAVPFAPSFGIVLALLFWSMFVSGANIITAVSYATTVFGPSQAGLIAGLGAGSWSLAVAISMPRFGVLIDRQDWTSAFGLATACAVAGYSLWLVLAGKGR